MYRCTAGMNRAHWPTRGCQGSRRIRAAPALHQDPRQALNHRLAASPCDLGRPRPAVPCLGFAVRNASGDREEGHADQAARSVRCRADEFGVAGVIVLLLALALYFLRDVSAAEASPPRHLGPLSAGRHLAA